MLITNVVESLARIYRVIQMPAKRAAIVTTYTLPQEQPGR